MRGTFYRVRGGLALTVDYFRLMGRARGLRHLVALQFARQRARQASPSATYDAAEVVAKAAASRRTPKWARRVRLKMFHCFAAAKIALRQSGDWRSQGGRGCCCVLDWRARLAAFC